MKRVVIIGRGASGKSTLAARLGEITGLPVIELDKVFWRPGLVATPRDQWVVVQERFVAEEGWIMDGDLGPYTWLRPGYVRRTRSFCWTSRSSAVLGEQYDDCASVLTSDGGLWRIAGKAVRFSWKRSRTTRSMRTSTYFATLRHSAPNRGEWIIGEPERRSLLTMVNDRFYNYHSPRTNAAQPEAIHMPD